MTANRRTIPGTPAPLLLLGFEGTSVDPRTAAHLRDGTAGGVVLYSRNVEGPAQVRELCREIRASAGKGLPAPLIAIDQEGGRVVRLKDPGFTRFPPARACSMVCPCRAESAAEAAGAMSAAELRAVGIDINFAPVLDVDSNPKNPVIGDRSFSSDPRQAAALGIAFMRGTLSGRVVPVGKHFPGHGDTTEDSHAALPRLAATRRELLSRELVPFRLAVRAGIPALMTAHVVYPALDPERPATLSHAILSGLLRKTLGFRGVLFSDALEMKAISGMLPPAEAAVAAAVAGCDVLLVCRGEDAQDEVIDSLARALREQADFRRAASASAKRLTRLRGILARWGTARGPLRAAGAPRHRRLAALLKEAWESNAQTTPAYIFDNIGED